MNCLKCNKEIDNEEKYCDECKKIIEQELFEEISNNRKLNEFEITKDVPVITDLNENTDILSDDFKDLINIEKEEKNKKIVLFISIGIAIVLLTILMVLIFNKKDTDEKPLDDTLNYKAILDEYGDLVKISVIEYIDKNDKVPLWIEIKEIVKYDKHKVTCNIHEIYEDKSIYLRDCSIDKTSVSYTYGKKKEKEDAKSINIYLSENGYTDIEEGNSVGSITCQTNECNFIKGYKKYVLIEEKNKYYIYDYEEDINKFGPFLILNNDYENNLLAYEDNLYGIYYIENNNKYIYNLKNSKIFEKLEGEIFNSSMNIDTRLLYKYGYVIFNNDGINNFINLNTGNVSYTINGNLNLLIEDKGNEILYMTVFNNLNKKITIYNSNGKKLFNGKEYNSFRLLNKEIIVYDDYNYYIYDSNLNLKLKSNTYNKVLAVYDDFIVVIDNGYLKIVNMNDDVLAKYDFKWDSSYSFDSLSSGKVENENTIYLVLQKDNEILKYYYKIDNEDFGKVS